MGWFETAIGTIVPGIGSVIGSGMEVAAQKDINQQNIELARENRAWQEKMSSTAFQRQTEDMRAAGLNPILGINKGGAVTPQGNVPALQAASYGKALKALSSTSMQIRQLNKELDKKDSEMALNQSINNLKQEEEKVATATAQKVRNDNLMQQANLKALEYEIPARIKEAENRQKQAEWDKDMMTYDNIIKRGKDTTNAIAPWIGLGAAAKGLRQMKKFQMEGFKKPGGKLPGFIHKSRDGSLINKKTGEILFDSGKRRLWTPHNMKGRK